MAQSKTFYELILQIDRPTGRKTQNSFVWIKAHLYTEPLDALLSNLPLDIKLTCLQLYSTRPAISKEELFKPWKRRHDTYIQKAIKITNRSKKRDQNRKIIKLQTLFNIRDKAWVRNDYTRDKLGHEWLGTVAITQISAPLYTIIK
jgi:hypothetical protein